MTGLMFDMLSPPSQLYILLLKTSPVLNIQPGHWNEAAEALDCRYEIWICSFI